MLESNQVRGLTMPFQYIGAIADASENLTLVISIVQSKAFSPITIQHDVMCKFYYEGFNPRSHP